MIQNQVSGTYDASYGGVCDISNDKMYIDNETDGNDSYLIIPISVEDTTPFPFSYRLTVMP